MDIQKALEDIKDDAHQALEAAFNSTNPDLIAQCKSHIGTCITTKKALERLRNSSNCLMDKARDVFETEQPYIEVPKAKIQF